MMTAIFGLVCIAALAAPAPETSPRPIQQLIGQAEVWSTHEIGQVAAFLEAPEYWMTEQPVIFITEGFVRYDHEIGSGVHTGEAKSGVWVNTSDRPVVVMGSDGQPFPMQPGSVIAIGDSIEWLEEPQEANDDGTPCSVTCRDSYFACCNNTGCRCRLQHQDDADCVGGGHGAAECSSVVKPTVPSDLD